MTKNYNLTLEWELITDCNYNCPYCFFDVQNTKKIDLYNRSYKIILNKIKTLPNNIRIILLGGEPTMHPKFKEIVEELISFDNIVEIEVITNGTSQVKYLRDILSNEKVVFNISLHFTHYHKKFINKLIKLNTESGLTVAVMIPPEEKYYNLVLETLQSLISNNINIELIEILKYKKYSVKMLSLFEQFNILRDDYQNKFIINNTKHKCEIRYYTINPFGILFCRCLPDFKKPFVSFSEKDILTINCSRERCPSGNCDASIKEPI